jgi:2',5'-phosphodiesterase
MRKHNTVCAMTPHQLRVVSYNVLSSSLSAPTFFAHSLEKHCSPRHRLEKLLTKLDAEVELGAVVCLQEVSLAWTGRLHAYFAAKRYTFVNSNYGNRNNNFMGVGVAFPSTRYALRMADLSVIADTKSGGWNAPRTAGAARPPAPAAPEPSWADALGSWFRRAVGQLPDCSPANRTSEASSDPAADEANEAWNLSKSKFNVMVSLRLRPLQDGEDDSREVVVATYHTPCVYWSPGAMTIHCALATQKVQTLAEGRFPYILTGDFNIKPGSPQYALLTTGVLPEKCADDSDPKVNGKPSFPSTPCFEGDKWAPTAFARGPMKSA